MDQVRLIQEASAVACLTESEVALQQLHLQNMMKEVQGFGSASDQPNLNLSQLSATSDNFIKSALTSSTEQALTKYRDPAKVICWGCGVEDDHTCYDTRLKKRPSRSRLKSLPYSLTSGTPAHLQSTPLASWHPIPRNMCLR
jgi:hypothetical protein